MKLLGFLCMMFFCSMQNASATGLQELLSLPHVNSPDTIAEWHLSADETTHVVTDPDMDCLDIEQEPNGTLVGVYHASQKISGRAETSFCLKIATAESVDQARWKHVVDIDCSGASQGSIKRLPGGEYLIAYEKKPSAENGRIHSFVEILYFPSFQDLKQNHFTLQYSVPEWNGDPNIIQGTPNFRNIQYNPDPGAMVIELGFHVGLAGHGVNAIGVLRGFKTWTAELNTVLNAKMVDAGVEGSIGGRAYIIYNGQPYTLVEGQLKPGPLTNFRLFLFDETQKTLAPLPFTTPNGGVAFGNPKLSYIFFKGQKILVGTSFSFNPAPYGANHLYTRPTSL